MRLFILILLSCLHLPFTILGQTTYVVQVEDREKTVALTNEAISKINENALDTAIVYLIKAITIDSTYHPSYVELYKACLQKKDFSQVAISYLLKAKRIFIEDDEIPFYLGEIYRMGNDIENAIFEYTQAIDISKTNGEEFYLVHFYHFNRGNCFAKINSLDLAINDYTYALKLKPDFSAAMTNRGICYFNKKEHC